MSRETWEILQQMEPKMWNCSLHCSAPLIAGLKPSNLFNIPCGVCQVRELIRIPNIHICAFSTGRKAAVFLIPKRKPGRIHGTGTGEKDAA